MWRPRSLLLDHLAHVREDLVGGGDGRPDPRLEAVAEGVQVAVRADARVRVGEPGATEARELLEHDERLLRVLVLQVICRADAGDPGPDDQHVEMFGGGGVGSVDGGLGLGHHLPCLPTGPAFLQPRVARVSDSRRDIGDTGPVRIDCAAYVDGCRREFDPDTMSIDDPIVDGGFVWLGLRMPDEAELQRGLTALGITGVSPTEVLTPHRRPVLASRERSCRSCCAQRPTRTAAKPSHWVR